MYMRLLWGVVLISMWSWGCSDSSPGKDEGDTDSEERDGGADTEVTAEEAVAEMRIGWNVGNSLGVPDGETAWGNPEVSAELIEAVADAGFDVVRIPVTWQSHLGDEPDYTIDEAWLDRVAEVVGYALDAGLYAVINMQRDEWISISGRNQEAVQAQFEAVWAQVAAHFKDVGSRLIFESMSEIQDNDKAPTTDHYAALNALNQVFVNAVRGEGGRNSSRLLAVSGYYARVEPTVEGLELPVDTAEDRLIAAVHYYDPYDFTGMATVHTWGAASEGSNNWGQEDAVIEKMDALKETFVDEGVPVLIGEYGAVHQDGYEDYRRYYLEYVTKAARDRGIVPIYWDNGNFSGGSDSFGLINRTTGEAVYPEILSTLMRAAKEDYSIDEVALPGEGETDTDPEGGDLDIGPDDSGLITWTDEEGDDFGIYLPEGWHGANLPVLMFLHGYTGNPIASPPWVMSAVNDKEPCAVFLPHRPVSEEAAAWGGTYDPELRPAMVKTVAMLDRVIEELGLDASRQYLYGESMGGEGVYALLYTYPERFADGVSVAGYTIVKGADEMAQTPLWIIHGSGDSTSDVSNARDIYAAIQDAGGEQVIYTEYEGVEHVPSISQAASEPGLVDWILSHTRE